MSYSTEFIRHEETPPHLLDKIIAIKSCAWPYPYHSQLAWIENNISSKDIHCLLLEENETIGYLNLVDISLSVNGKMLPGYGVGNVCSRHPGHGDGKRLILAANEYIRNSGRAGFLFCKPQLTGFYTKCGWSVIPNADFPSGINGMIYNSQTPVTNFRYDGKVF